MNKPPLILPSTKRRDLLFIVCGVLVTLALGFYIVTTMGDGVAGNTLAGTIVKKEFTPQPEEQVTLGQAGLHARHIDGKYLFEVRVGERTYNVWVDKKDYEARKVGDVFAFLRPRD